MDKKELLRSLPKIDELLKEELIINEMEHSMRNVVIDSLRDTIEYYRTGILNGSIKDFTKDDILHSFALKIKKSNSPHLKRVINATGVVIHTNLGRSVLCKEAATNVLNVAENYNNLEYNLEEGKRGSRYSHVESLITKITGAEAAMVVNNNAAAVLLTMDTLCRGKEAVVSRGQLVEIGGSFRIPDVMKFSGAELVEVGTTNRTHLYDFENAITDKTGILLKVHTSNYKILGFTEEVPLEDIAGLGRKHSIPVVEDIGSGTLIDFGKYGLSPEPTVQSSIKNGADVVMFSGDKMLGGPQAGIIVGKKIYIDMMKKNQLTRALRIDKMTLAALEGTLKYYLDEKAAIENIPTMNMLLATSELQKKRAYRLKRKLQNKAAKFKFSVGEDYSVVGGGSMPAEKIKTFVIKARCSSMQPEKIEKMLRGSDIPIIVRVSNDEVILDVRTIFDKDFDIIADTFETIVTEME